MVLPSQYGDLQTNIEMSAKCLSNGGVAAVPTDTLYAFAASVFIEKSVERIFDLKGRPNNQGMPVLLDGIDRVNSCVLDIPELALPLMDVFWPGPLTIVLRRSPAVPRGEGSTPSAPSSSSSPSPSPGASSWVPSA